MELQGIKKQVVFTSTVGYVEFVNDIGIEIDSISVLQDNKDSYQTYLTNHHYREEYLAAKEWFDILRSHNFQLPTKKVDTLIQIHKTMSNLK